MILNLGVVRITMSIIDTRIGVEALINHVISLAFKHLREIEV